MLRSLGSKIPLEKGQEPCAGVGLLGASGLYKVLSKELLAQTWSCGGG